MYLINGSFSVVVLLNLGLKKRYFLKILHQLPTRSYLTSHPKHSTSEQLLYNHKCMCCPPLLLSDVSICHILIRNKHMDLWRKEGIFVVLSSSLLKKKKICYEYCVNEILCCAIFAKISLSAALNF